MKISEGTKDKIFDRLWLYAVISVICSIGFCVLYLCKVLTLFGIKLVYWWIPFIPGVIGFVVAMAIAVLSMLED